ncbi:AraC family transcriptional regulator [Sphingobium sp. SCG-1]|nr:AraC family transcriptional regulator [Sphingobium sp. SCG-1]
MCYPDDDQRNVFGHLASLEGHGERHSHSKAQLLCALKGVITVEAATGIWTVPPGGAIWIPGGYPHSARTAGSAEVGCLYLAPELALQIGTQCGILFFQPLLREVVLRFLEGSAPSMNDARLIHLANVLLDELQAAPKEPFRLPMPMDRRVRRIAESLLDEPSQRLTVEEWGKRTGASKRTLSRAFLRETGMTFVKWRQQLHVGLALQRLAAGEQVTNIAIDLGYENVSAFISMFKRRTGTTPARYFQNTANGATRVRDETAKDLPSRLNASPGVSVLS